MAKILCICPSLENNGYFCQHGNWIKSEYAKRGYRKLKSNPHAVALGALGGQKRSEAKTVAARENGKKGGRPKRKSA